jgi:hypothetical protein
VTVRGFPFVSLRARPGDRLALAVRPPHRRWQTNRQAGGATADETGGRPATVTLTWSPDRPSRLLVPSGPAATAGSRRAGRAGGSG